MARSISPLTRRRLAAFRRNRRGHVSLWLLLGLFVTSLCAELLASSRPLLLGYRGELYFPVFAAYPETAR